MRLYSYWRSGASYRVRLALQYKALDYEYVAVNLLVGEQREEAHQSRNPSRTVPVLELDDDGELLRLSQSVAIAEYLDERWPERPLFPGNRRQRAKIRMLSELVNSGIQPLHNAAVTKYLHDELKQDEAAWTKRWIHNGLVALERMAAPLAGQHLVGDIPSFADCCLTSQLFSARRFKVDLAEFPTLSRAEANFVGLPRIAAAHPDVQPDTPRT